jgi:cytochrome c oxidase cbb3-type subunit 3
MRRCLVASLALGLLGCQREERETRTDPPVAAALAQYALQPNRIGGAPPDVYTALGRPYETNAYDLSQGKALYEQFNCKGCHADGGGNSGPALLDGWWRYGPDMVSLVATLREGRPRGMPAYKDRLTNDQTWQLAGYVQTIGAYSAKTAAPSRSDSMQTRPAENRAPAAAALSGPPSR